jgi:hypothetical protein
MAGLVPAIHVFAAALFLQLLQRCPSEEALGMTAL